MRSSMANGYGPDNEMQDQRLEFQFNQNIFKTLISFTNDQT